MRIATLAITVMLAAFVAFPADAAKERPSQAAGPAYSTCTGMKSLCLSRNECNNGENGVILLSAAGNFATLHGNDT
jgi:hypothetical protein